MWVYLTWLVLDIIMAGGGLSNMVVVRYYHELVSVYPTWLWLLSYAAGVLSNMLLLDILLGPPGCAQVSPYLSPGLLDFLVV